MTDKALPSAAVEALAEAVGREHVLLDPADRWTYGYDNSRRQAQPGAVVMPATTEEVRALVAACRQFRLPLTTRGRGTDSHHDTEHTGESSTHR